MSNIKWFDEVGINDISEVGGKNASLGEMYSNLTAKGVKVPNGFATTSRAFDLFIDSNNLRQKIKDELNGLDTHDVVDLAKRGYATRQLLLDARFPKELRTDMLEHFAKLREEADSVAVRSSATAEDLPDASFAGQQETFLNIRTEEEFLLAVKKCMASLFTNRAISYREDKHFDHFAVKLSVGVQTMVRSDLASSGVMFTLDTESGFQNAVFITGSWGLGENIVQGAVNPDEYYVFKPTLDDYQPIISKTIGSKRIKMIYDQEGTSPVKNVRVPIAEQHKFVLNDEQILQLARWAVIIEKHYDKPMDIEWALDGKSGELFIVQARPETVQSRRDINIIEEYSLSEEGEVVITGKSVGAKVAAGKVHVIKTVEHIADFKAGEVLVTEMTDPDWEPIMKIASAIITERGGRTCHAAIIAREMGIPAIVGAEGAIEALEGIDEVTIDTTSGDTGRILKGILKWKVNQVDIGELPKTKTKVYINVGDPQHAFKLSFLPCDGVGLAREEFIINNFVSVHPMALIHPEKVDADTRAKIDERTHGFADKKEFFVQNLSYGIATIAAAFHPRPVVLRTSDFKTNEYRSLLGGKFFEPIEDNPMIGWRGASRYWTDYKEAFELELVAIKRVLETMGLTNLKVMIPFVRTIKEAKEVMAMLEKYGIDKLTDIYAMCEIPANAILADEFLEIFDGYSIGSNDLTQLTLGIDRDNEMLASSFDERNPAVTKLMAMAIQSARKNGKYIGICGQAPSDHPEILEFLVKEQIETLSLNPDTFFKGKLKVAEMEKRLG